MYEVRFKGKQKKNFIKLLRKLSPRVKSKLRYTLENNPYTTPSYRSILCKVEKKGNFYCIEVTGGDRILYDIVEMDEQRKAILVYFAGDHDGEIRFLRHSK